MKPRLLAFVVGALFIVAVLYIVFASETMTNQQFFVIRLVAALAAAGFAALLPGFLNIEMKLPTNVAVRGGGAIGVFLLVWFVNPPPIEPVNDGDDLPLQHEGFLGDLSDHLDRRVDIEEFSLVFDSEHGQQLRDLFIDPVAGSTWDELLRKICNKYSCLVCTFEPEIDAKQVTLSVSRGPLVPTEDSASLERKKLRCPERVLT